MSEIRPSFDPAYAPVPRSPTGNGFGVASLVLGIVGICVGIVPLFIGLFLSFVPVLLAIVFGICGVVRANRTGGIGFGLALTGLILGGITFLLWFVGYGWLW